VCLALALAHLFPLVSEALKRADLLRQQLSFLPIELFVGLALLFPRRTPG
jgi:hypothetical protein